MTRRSKPAQARKGPAASDAPAPAAPPAALVPLRWALGAMLGAIVLWQLYFPPVNLWVAGFALPALWAFGALGLSGGRRGFFILWALGLLNWLVAIYWMSWVTPIGWLGLALYMGLYWPVGAWLLVRLNRPLNCRWGGKTPAAPGVPAASPAESNARYIKVPMAVSLGLLWVAMDLGRARLLSGFPWFLLAHGLYARPLWIQTADFAGAYGPGFVLAAVGGAAAEWLLYLAVRPRGERRDGAMPDAAALRSCVVSSVLAAALLAGMLVYGGLRLAQADAALAALTAAEAAAASKTPAASDANTDSSIAPPAPSNAPQAPPAPSNAPQVPPAPHASYQRMLEAGPRVVVGQSAFPISIYAHRGPQRDEIVEELIARSPLAADAPPELIIWPETVLPAAFEGPPGSLLSWPQLDAARFEPDDRPYVEEMQGLHRAVRDLLDVPGRPTPLLAGGMVYRSRAGAGGDASAAGGSSRLQGFNAALLVRPSDPARAEATGRLLEFPLSYAKMHCVPFGEYTPFERTLPPLYRLLRLFVPEEMDQLTPGRRPLRFEVDLPGGGCSGFATAICYEGVIARVCRRLIWRGEDFEGRPVGTKADFLVNISNDGWFIWPFGQSNFASGELDQHLAAYPFRAVENRVEVIRAVNTGVSAHIDSSGRIRSLVRAPDGRTKMVPGTLTARVLIDRRISFYGRCGDVFAWSCLVALALLLAAPRRVLLAAAAKGERA